MIYTDKRYVAKLEFKDLYLSRLPEANKWLGEVNVIIGKSLDLDFMAVMLGLYSSQCVLNYYSDLWC